MKITGPIDTGPIDTGSIDTGLSDTGNGDAAFVLVHGICCKPEDYQWHIDAFSQVHRVVAPVLRGHSNDGSLASDMSVEQLAADVIQLLHDKKIRNAIMCGHSLGSRVVLEAHAQCPELISGLVLIDGSNMVSGNLEVVLDGFESVAKGDNIECWLQEQFKLMFLPGTFSTERAMYRERIAQLSKPHLGNLYRNLICWDANRFEDRLQLAHDKPILLLQATLRSEDGSRRSLEPGETGTFPEFVVQHHSGTDIIVYPNRSHFIHLDEPELLFKDIVSWMNENGLNQ